jgi:hypothetical protein
MIFMMSPSIGDIFQTTQNYQLFVFAYADVQHPLSEPEFTELTQPPQGK